MPLRCPYSPQDLSTSRCSYAQQCYAESSGQGSALTCCRLQLPQQTPLLLRSHLCLQTTGTMMSLLCLTGLHTQNTQVDLVAEERRIICNASAVLRAGPFTSLAAFTHPCRQLSALYGTRRALSEHAGSQQMQVKGHPTRGWRLNLPIYHC